MKIKVIEIIDPELKFLSVVDRGATGAPFKMIKNESKTMKKLSDIIKGLVTSDKKEGSIESSQGLVIQKSAMFTNAKEIAATYGFNEVIDNGKVIIYQKKEVDVGSMAMLQVNDGAHLLFKIKESVAMDSDTFKLNKAFFDSFGEALEFDEAEQRLSLIPKLMAPIEALGSIFMNVLNQDLEDPQAVMLKAVSDLNDFLPKIIKDLPTNLLKMAHVIGVSLKSETKISGKKISKSEESTVNKTEETKNKIEGEPVTFKDLDKILKAISEFKIEVTDNLSSVNESIVGLQGRVAGVESLSKKHGEALTGKAVHTSDAIDTEALKKLDEPKSIFDGAIKFA